MTIHEFIKERPHLIWYTKNYEDLSEGSIVEATLNYGDFDDVKKLIEILRVKRVAEIFREQTRQKRCNYHKKTKHYFSLYFDEHAHA